MSEINAKYTILGYNWNQRLSCFKTREEVSASLGPSGRNEAEFGAHWWTFPLGPLRVSKHSVVQGRSCMCWAYTDHGGSDCDNSVLKIVFPGFCSNIGNAKQAASPLFHRGGVGSQDCGFS